MPDGKPMLGAQRLYVNLQLASVWNRGATFQDIELEHPSVHALLHTDGSLNLADLAKPFAKEPPSPPSPPARVFLARLAVSGGEFTFLDLGHPTTLHATLSPVNFELRGFQYRRQRPRRLYLGCGNRGRRTIQLVRDTRHFAP